MKKKISQNKAQKTHKVAPRGKKVLTEAHHTRVQRKTAAKTTHFPFEQGRIGLHNLKLPRGMHKVKKLLGRGSSSGHGKTSTRGSKGQTSRAGRDVYLGFEGGQTPLIRRIPKRGFNSLFRKEYQIVNLRDLNKLKESTINPALLEEQGLIKDKDKFVKILGDGEIKNPLVVKAHAVSKNALAKIAHAGGKVEILKIENA